MARRQEFWIVCDVCGAGQARRFTAATTSRDAERSASIRGWFLKKMEDGTTLDACRFCYEHAKCQRDDGCDGLRRSLENMGFGRRGIDEEAYARLVAVVPRHLEIDDSEQIDA